MSEPDSNVRRTGLMFFPNVALKLRELFSSAGIPVSEWADVCAECVSAKCTICEETLSGSEFGGWLMSLGDGLPVGKRAMRYIRLERGCCGNTSCNATFYEIRLAPHPFLAWEQLAIGALEEHQEEKPGTAGVVAVAGWELAKKQISRRTIGALVALLTLWLFHQWYHGGSIPLIRGERTFSAEAGPAEGDDAP